MSKLANDLISALTEAKELDEYENPYLVSAVIEALNEQGVAFDCDGLSEWAISLWSR